MTWLALAPRALHNIRPRSQGSLLRNEVPVHSSSCHVQSYPRKDVSLNSWLTQRYFFKTLLLYTPPHPQKNRRQMSSISPHFPPLLETMTLLRIISKSAIVVMYQTLNEGIITLASISDLDKWI